VGQVVAESIRIYGENFVRCLAIGVVPAALTLASAHVSRRLALILTPTLSGALLSATFVYASTIVLEQRPPLRRLARAWFAGWLVFVPAPFLLAILVFVMQFMLAFLIRGAADEALETAFVLASVVISPLVFIGAALLYVDQAARVK